MFDIFSLNSIQFQILHSAGGCRPICLSLTKLLERISYFTDHEGKKLFIGDRIDFDLDGRELVSLISGLSDEDFSSLRTLLQGFVFGQKLDGRDPGDAWHGFMEIVYDGKIGADVTDEMIKQRTAA